MQSERARPTLPWTTPPGPSRCAAPRFAPSGTQATTCASPFARKRSRRALALFARGQRKGVKRRGEFLLRPMAVYVGRSQPAMRAPSLWRAWHPSAAGRHGQDRARRTLDASQPPQYLALDCPTRRRRVKTATRLPTRSLSIAGTAKKRGSRRVRTCHRCNGAVLTAPFSLVFMGLHRFTAPPGAEDRAGCGYRHGHGWRTRSWHAMMCAVQSLTAAGAEVAARGTYTSAVRPRRTDRAQPPARLPAVAQ